MAKPKTLCRRTAVRRPGVEDKPLQSNNRGNRLAAVWGPTQRVQRRTEEEVLKPDAYVIELTFKRLLLEDVRLSGISVRKPLPVGPKPTTDR